MNGTPKHRWFRFHLSTSLVLVFAAAGFIALNLLPSPPVTVCLALFPSSGGPAVLFLDRNANQSTYLVTWKYGFPEPFVSKNFQIEGRIDAPAGEILAKVPIDSGEFSSLKVKELAYNSIWAFLLLFLLAVICEGTIRLNPSAILRG